MFGKPEWFAKKKLGWGLKPKRWQGWVYTVVWAFVIIGPSLFLAARSQLIEAGVWISVSIGGLIWDAWGILRQMNHRTEVEEFFYIGEEGGREAETENHQLRVKS
jgi:hypothetical protein